jgi:hypothetical protein
MKSLTKKALSLAMAIAMAGSCMAFASTVTIGEVTEDGTSVSIPYETTETDQVTVIVYEVADENDATAPAADTIGYINQIDAPDGGKDTITFTMRDKFVANDAIANGIYKVIMGGTGVGEADVAYLIVTDDVVILKGDVNGDTYVNANDIDAIVNYILAGNTGLNETQFAAANVNGDDYVNANDIDGIVSYILAGNVWQ